MATGKTQLEIRNDEIARQKLYIEELTENMAYVTAMLAREDIGWRQVFARDDTHGFNLVELQQWARQIRDSIYGNPHIKSGFQKRLAYIWQGGIKYKNIPGPTQGRKSSDTVQRLIDDPMNKKHFFGGTARRKREAALFSDSVAFYVGDDRTKMLHPIPLNEITADYRDPDYSTDIWAFRRSWQSFENGQANSELSHKWYFTDTYISKKVSAIKLGGDSQEVDQNSRIFDLHANQLEGFAYGAADAVAALIWSRKVRDLYMNGVSMTDALSTFAFKATTKTVGAGANAAMKLGGANPAGSSAILGATNDLVPMASAGKGYEFDSFRPVAAIVAVALDLPVEDLLGQGTGDLKELDSLPLSTRLPLEARRDEHIDFDKRVLRWMGAPDAEVYFQSLRGSTEIFRRQQGIAIKWGTGAYTALEIKTELEHLEGNDVTAVTIPDGVLVPNTKETATFTAKLAQTFAPTPPPSASGDPTHDTTKDGYATQGAPLKGVKGKGPNANDLNSDRASGKD